MIDSFSSFIFVNKLYINFTKISNFGTRSRTRTGTPKHLILSQTSLPFHHSGMNKIESVMRRPIADIKPFTSSLISNCLVMSEDNQSVPVSSHQILDGR